jgi:hypothetical protein
MQIEKHRARREKPSERFLENPTRAYCEAWGTSDMAHQNVWQYL